jgi:hypothetical protein
MLYSTTKKDQRKHAYEINISGIVQFDLCLSSFFLPHKVKWKSIPIGTKSYPKGINSFAIGTKSSIKDPIEDALFFVCAGMQYHLLACLRDAAMMQWMCDFNNLISVLKPGFPAFEKEVLQRIEAIYTVVRK